MKTLKKIFLFIVISSTFPFLSISSSYGAVDTGIILEGKLRNEEGKELSIKELKVLDKSQKVLNYRGSILGASFSIIAPQNTSTLKVCGLLESRLVCAVAKISGKGKRGIKLVLKESKFWLDSKGLIDKNFYSLAEYQRRVKEDIKACSEAYPKDDDLMDCVGSRLENGEDLVMYNTYRVDRSAVEMVTNMEYFSFYMLEFYNNCNSMHICPSSKREIDEVNQMVVEQFNRDGGYGKVVAVKDKGRNYLQYASKICIPKVRCITQSYQIEIGAEGLQVRGKDFFGEEFSKGLNFEYRDYSPLEIVANV